MASQNQGYNQEDVASALVRQRHFWLLLLAGLTEKVEHDHLIPEGSPYAGLLLGAKYLFFILSYFLAATWTPKRRPYSPEERIAAGLTPTEAQQRASATTTAVITAAAVAAATAAAPPPAPPPPAAPPAETPTANLVAAAVTAAVAAAVAAPPPAPAAPVEPAPVEVVVVEEPKAP